MTAAQQRFSVLLTTVIAVAVIWLPIGVSQLTLIEDWGHFSVFQEAGGATFWATGQFRMRPLCQFLISLSYQFPKPYLVMHALLALSLIVKGLSMAYIAQWLTRDRLIGVLAGVVFIVHPADTMQMGFRSLVIIWPAALCAAATALYLAATEARSPQSRTALAIGAGASLLVAGLMYEAALALAVAPFLIQYAGYGYEARRHIRDQWQVAAVWFSALAINLGYIASQIGGPSYQASLFAGAPSLWDMPKHLVMTGLYRTLLQGWADGLSMLAANIMFIPYLIGGVALAVWLHARYVGWQCSPPQPSVALRTMGVGLALATLGYAPFLVSLPHIYISQRTYLYATMGGAIAAIGVLMLVQSLNRGVFAGLAALLIASGFGSQWEQLAHYTDLSNRQRMYLSGILQAAPDAGSSPGQQLHITDRTGALSNTWMLRGDILPMALSHLQGHAVKAVVCTGPNGQQSSFVTDQYGVTGVCPSVAADVIRIVIEPDGSSRRINGSSPPPDPRQLDRWHANLGCSPCAYASRETVGASWRYDFGKWWSLEHVPWGGGWTDAGWIPPPAWPVSYAWMIAPRSTLLFRVMPQGKEYHLSVGVNASVSQQARETLTAGVNGQAIPLKWSTSTVLSGTFSRSTLADGLNEIVLSATPGGSFSISNRVDWVVVAPVR